MVRVLSFAALADPTRRQIVEMLARRERPAGEIAKRRVCAVDGLEDDVWGKGHAELEPASGLPYRRRGDAGFLSFRFACRQGGLRYDFLGFAPRFEVAP